MKNTQIREEEHIIRVACTTWTYQKNPLPYSISHTNNTKGRPDSSKIYNDNIIQNAMSEAMTILKILCYNKSKLIPSSVFNLICHSVFSNNLSEQNMMQVITLRSE